jgi:hypothetical protein
VEMKHLRDFGCGEHRTKFVDGHRSHVLVAFRERFSAARAPAVLRGRVRPAWKRNV